MVVEEVVIVFVVVVVVVVVVLVEVVVVVEVVVGLPIAMHWYCTSRYFLVLGHGSPKTPLLAENWQDCSSSQRLTTASMDLSDPQSHGSPF